jgi:hypothetical protein
MIIDSEILGAELAQIKKGIPLSWWTNDKWEVFGVVVLVVQFHIYKVSFSLILYNNDEKEAK